MKNYVNGYWYVTSNVGDNLAPYLIKKISGKPSVYTPLHSKQLKCIVTGSIITEADENCIVWGAGLANATDKINPKANIMAVRGPLTRKIAQECKIKCPEVYGDPALLLPRFYNPKIDKKYKLGIIPHFVDQLFCFEHYKNDDEVKIIDVLLSPEDFVDEVLSCEKIISSSLHGLIISMAYGIPSLWVKFTNGVLGDGTKFNDFFDSVKIPRQNFLDLRDSASFATKEFLSKIPDININIDLDKLLNNCPFK